MRTPHPMGWEIQSLQFAMCFKSQEFVTLGQARCDWKPHLPRGVRDFLSHSYYDEISTGAYNIHVGSVRVWVRQDARSNGGAVDKKEFSVFTALTTLMSYGKITMGGYT